MGRECGKNGGIAELIDDVGEIQKGKATRKAKMYVEQVEGSFEHGNENAGKFLSRLTTGGL
jgi:hypothetical protein